jgi:hypothetical protein
VLTFGKSPRPRPKTLAVVGFSLPQICAPRPHRVPVWYVGCLVDPCGFNVRCRLSWPAGRARWASVLSLCGVTPNCLCQVFASRLRSAAFCDACALARARLAQLRGRGFFSLVCTARAPTMTTMNESRMKSAGAQKKAGCQRPLAPCGDIKTPSPQSALAQRAVRWPIASA